MELQPKLFKSVKTYKIKMEDDKVVEDEEPNQSLLENEDSENFIP